MHAFGCAQPTTSATPRFIPKKFDDCCAKNLYGSPLSNAHLGRRRYTQAQSDAEGWYALQLHIFHGFPHTLAGNVMGWPLPAHACSNTRSRHDDELWVVSSIRPTGRVRRLRKSNLWKMVGPDELVNGVRAQAALCNQATPTRRLRRKRLQRKEREKVVGDMPSAASSTRNCQVFFLVVGDDKVFGGGNVARELFHVLRPHMHLLQQTGLIGRIGAFQLCIDAGVLGSARRSNCQ